MTVALVLTDSMDSSIAKAIDTMGMIWKQATTIEEANSMQPEGGWSCCVMAFSNAERMMSTETKITPTIAVVAAEWSMHLERSPELFEDFVIRPIGSDELRTRLARAIQRIGDAQAVDVLEFGAIRLDLATYQCTVDERSLDFTYMEYELLRYLMANAGHVFSREHLLKEVWGYEYYGGARTVDVHVRRLRAKIGEERAQVIQTVRSVGYMLGDV